MTGTITEKRLTLNGPVQVTLDEAQLITVNTMLANGIFKNCNNHPDLKVFKSATYGVSEDGKGYFYSVKMEVSPGSGMEDPYEQLRLNRFGAVAKWGKETFGNTAIVSYDIDSSPDYEPYYVAIYLNLTDPKLMSALINEQNKNPAVYASVER